MRKYLSFFRIRFTNSLQYRAAAYAGIATQFAWGFMELFLFAAFYRSDPSAFPMSFPQLASYIWLQQAFLALFLVWFLENDIFEAIANGGVAYELGRPMDIYNMWFVKSMASRSAKTLLRSMPILLIAAFLPAPYGFGLPSSTLSFAFFALSLLLCFLVVVSFCMLIYISAFFTLSPLGVRIVAISLVELLSGSVIPLPFLPDSLRRIVELLPFASMQNMPFRLYSGNIAGLDRLIGISLQVFWLVALVVLGKLLMKKALKRVVIQGG